MVGISEVSAGRSIFGSGAINNFANPSRAPVLPPLTQPSAFLLATASIAKRIELFLLCRIATEKDTSGSMVLSVC